MTPPTPQDWRKETLGGPGLGCKGQDRAQVTGRMWHLSASSKQWEWQGQRGACRRLSIFLPGPQPPISPGATPGTRGLRADNGSFMWTSTPSCAQLLIHELGKGPNAQVVFRSRRKDVLIEEIRAAAHSRERTAPWCPTGALHMARPGPPQVIWDDLALRNHTGGETEAQQQPVTQLRSFS